MLELYEAYADYTDIMELVEELVAYLATELLGTTKLTYGGRDLDLTPPWRRATMADLVEEQIGVRVDLRTPIDELRALADEHGVHVEGRLRARASSLLEIYEKTTEAELWGPVFVMDYPKEVSPLARDHREMPGFVERFEAIVAGRELVQRVQRAHRPRRAARHGSRRRRRPRPPATTRRWRSTRTTSEPSSTGSRPPVAWASASTGSSCSSPTRPPSATSSCSRP